MEIVKWGRARILPRGCVADTEYGEHVRKLVKSYQRRDLPGTLSPFVQRKLIKECVKKWEAPSRWYLDNIFDLVQNQLFKLVDANFKTLNKLRIHIRYVLRFVSIVM